MDLQYHILGVYDVVSEVVHESSIDPYYVIGIPLVQSQGIFHNKVLSEVDLIVKLECIMDMIAECEIWLSQFALSNSFDVRVEPIFLVFFDLAFDEDGIVLLSPLPHEVFDLSASEDDEVHVSHQQLGELFLVILESPLDPAS